MNSTCSASVPARFRPVAGIAFLALVALGCQGQGNLSGKVSYQNKPVGFGTILMQGSDGNAKQGNIEKDGSYSVRGVATGAARVAVNSPDPKSITLLPNKNPKNKQEPYPDVPGWFAIPNHYENVATSGLTYTIKGGSNTIDIELK